MIFFVQSIFKISKFLLYQSRTNQPQQFFLHANKIHKNDMERLKHTNIPHIPLAIFPLGKNGLLIQIQTNILFSVPAVLLSKQKLQYVVCTFICRLTNVKQKILLPYKYSQPVHINVEVIVSFIVLASFLMLEHIDNVMVQIM